MLGLAVERRHRLRQLLIDEIVDRDRSEIGIFAVETAGTWLIGMLEPVIAD